MYDKFNELLVSFDSICYDDELTQNEMVNYALKVGLFASKRKVAMAVKISEGFYTNVGNFSSGLTMSPEKYSKDKFKLLKTFLLRPDVSFSAILRMKPYLYSKKKYFLVYLIPMWLIYRYIKLNRWAKNTIFKKIFRFKYAHLK